MHLSFRNYITAGAVLLALGTANLLLWHDPRLGAILILGMLLHGAALGALALPRLSPGWRITFGTLTVVAAETVMGTILYYLADLGPASLLTTAALPFFAIAGWWSRARRSLEVAPPREGYTRHPDIPAGMVGLGVLMLDAGAFLILHLSRTSEAIRSPWEVVPWQFFLLFGIASAGLITLALKNRGRRILLVLSILHAFVGLAPAITVYNAGFGFDPFIHQAAESVIARDGAILPKTPYYIGHYAQVILAARLTGLPPASIDRPLVPVAAALVIPLLLFALSRIWMRKDRHDDTPLAPFAFLLPVPMFILTTPQGNANLWLLATAVAVALAAVPAWIPWTFALAAAAIHPIAGVPALALAAFGTLSRIKKHSPLIRSSVPLLFALTVAALPLAFVLNAIRGGVLDVEYIRPTIDTILRILPFPTLAIPDHYDLPLDLAYLLRWNVPIIILALAGYGIWNAAHRDRAKTLLPHITVALAIGASYLLLRGLLRFPGIIAYENTIFSQRFLEVAAIALVPAMAAGVLALLDRATAPSLRIFAVVLLSGMTIASVYLSYPRIDRYEKNSGRGLSRSMVNAVRFLEENARDPYIVLADQTAAGAQISRFGFGPYYNGSYFYAHPSGGLPLYRFYERMVEEGPTREIMAEAMDASDTDKAYLIVHDYWKNFRKIVAAAQENADDWVEIDGGAVYIFRYTTAGSPGTRSAEIF